MANSWGEGHLSCQAVKCPAVGKKDKCKCPGIENESNRTGCETQQFMHSNDKSFRDQEPQQIHRIHENDKKQSYSRRVLDFEHGLFTPLVFTTTGGIGKECIRYYSRLAELIAALRKENITRKQFPGFKQGHPLPFLGQPWFAFMGCCTAFD